VINILITFVFKLTAMSGDKENTLLTNFNLAYKPPTITLELLYFCYLIKESNNLRLHSDYRLLYLKQEVIQCLNLI